METLNESESRVRCKLLSLNKTIETLVDDIPQLTKPLLEIRETLDI